MSNPAEPDLLALLSQSHDLLAPVGADGVALVRGDDCQWLGRVPPEAWLRRLAAGLPQAPDTPWATESLSAEHTEAASFADLASGLLGLRLPDRWASGLLWFRPELARACPAGAGPSRIVRGRSRPWSAGDIDAARELGRSLTGIILRRAEAQAALSEELSRSNRELEAFAYSVSHDLRAPFRHVVGFAQLLRERLAGQLDATAERYLATITESGLAAGRLVDDLLAFSQLGRAGLARGSVDMARLVADVRRGLELDLAGRHVEWRVAELPPAWGDVAMLRQVVQNLLSNAVKYTRGRDPGVINCEERRSRRVNCEERRSRRGGAGLLGARQRYRLRHGLCRQAVRRVPAPAPRRGLRRQRHRPGPRAPCHRAPWRQAVGGGRAGSRRHLLLCAADTAACAIGIDNRRI